MNRNKTAELIFALVFLAGAGAVLYHSIYLKAEEDKLEYFEGKGRSMEPTFKTGDVLVVDKIAKPHENDIIVFDCIKCPGTDPEEGNIMTKRVMRIDEKSCFWVEGDNKEVSYDSRQAEVGWLCPSDLEVLGVVKRIENKK